MNRIIGILVKPVGTIREINEEKVDLNKPFLIVFLIAFFNFITAFFMLNEMAKVLPKEHRPFFWAGATGGVLGATLAVFLNWIIIAGIFHLLALALGGKGSFRKILEIFGWAHIPKIFSAIFVLIIIVTMFPKEVPSSIDVESIRLLFQNSLSIKATKIIQRIFLYWTLSLLGIGIYFNHKISKIRTTLVIVLPVLIYTFFDVFLKDLILRYLGFP
ncbi:MAG: Yip1 family protein [Methanosarcinales archaeon]